MDPARRRLLMRSCVALCVLALLGAVGTFLTLHVLLIKQGMLPPGVGYGITLGIGDVPEAQGQCPGSRAAYVLDEAWVGGSGSFFSTDSWHYMHGEIDPTGGPTQYVDFDTARRAGMIEEGDGWAVLRAGKPVDCLASDDCSMSSVPGARQYTEGPHLRQSVRITSRKSWRHFLLSVQYTHLPHGCGLWPALWFWCADVDPPPGGGEPRCPQWPAGGEFDLLEYANYFASKTSLHLGEDLACLLDRDAVHACGNFVDKNSMLFDCETNYSPAGTARAKYGCAPNQYESWPTVFDLNAQAGDGCDATLVLEFSDEAIKVWHFHKSDVPLDLLDDAPSPGDWDTAKLWSYYPLGQSDCPGKETIGAQNLVINLAFCGEWAGANWEQPADSWRLGGPTWQDFARTMLTGNSCAKAHGNGGQSSPEEACIAHVLDANASASLDDTAFFNFSHIKIFVPVGEGG